MIVTDRKGAVNFLTLIITDAIRKNHQHAKASGWCDQCMFPWFDGECECGHWKEVPEGLERAALTMDPRELYYLTCELKGEKPIVSPFDPAILQARTLDATPEELEALWETPEES